MVVRPHDFESLLFLPSLALDSGTPCQNDGVGAGKLLHLKFSHYPLS